MRNSFPLVALLFISFSACTKKEVAPPPAAEPTAQKEPASAPAGKTVSLKGSVTAKGKGTSAETIRMSADKFCSTYWKGKNPQVKKVEVGSNGGLKGAVVYLKEGPKATVAPGSSVVLDQKGCLYEPTVLALQVGQTLSIKNSDATMHNVHALPKTNSEFNFGMPSVGATDRKFSKPEVGIKVKCDVHGWMTANISVFDHPYFAVTDENGAFEILNVPEGKYTLEAYHPTLGTKAVAWSSGADSSTISY